MNHTQFSEIVYQDMQTHPATDGRIRPVSRLVLAALISAQERYFAEQAFNGGGVYVTFVGTFGHRWRWYRKRYNFKTGAMVSTPTAFSFNFHGNLDVFTLHKDKNAETVFLSNVLWMRSGIDKEICRNFTASFWRCLRQQTYTGKRVTINNIGTFYSKMSRSITYWQGWPRVKVTSAPVLRLNCYCSRVLKEYAKGLRRI